MKSDNPDAKLIFGIIRTRHLAAAVIAVLCVLQPWDSQAAAALAPTNHLSRLSVAVLPLNNVSGDASLGDWRHGFAEMLAGRLAWAKRVDILDWKELSAALTNAGWATNRAVDAKLAERVARESAVDAVIWGQYTCPAGEWALQLTITRSQPTNQPEAVEVKGRALAKLLIDAPENLARSLGTPIAPEDLNKMRRRGTNSNTAWDRYAHVLSLERANAASSDREKLLRQILADEPSFVAAHRSLAEILESADRLAEAEVEARRLVSEDPGICSPHLMLAWLACKSEKWPEAERELREALRVHPGCPGACDTYFKLMHNMGRWQELREILEKANTERPDEASTLAFLADARAHCGDLDGAKMILQELGTVQRQDVSVHMALLETAIGCRRLLAAGREVRWLHAHAADDPEAREMLGMADASFVLTVPMPLPHPVLRPRSYTSAALKAELERRLTPEELALAVNPVEITPEILKLSKELTSGLTNQTLRALVLFTDVAERGRGSGKGGSRTARQVLASSGDPQARFSCQEFAKLFVALARAAGLEAWLVHVDVLEDGRPIWHDCAALILPNQAFLVDPTWGTFGIDHQEFRVLDDLQAIADQAMQGDDKTAVARKRMGAKLDPNDAWTRLQLVAGLAKDGLTTEAEAELARLGTNYTARWDFYHTTGVLEASRERWQPALSAFQHALSLSPSNFFVHLALANTYNALNNNTKATEHAEMAARLDEGNALDFKSDRGRFDLKMIGALAQTESRNPNARQELQRQAEAGDAAAQFALAKLLFESKPPNYDEGMEWMRKAAEQGNDDIQQNYASNLLAFRGPSAGPEAAKWLSRSAEQGNTTAQFRLGRLLYEGKLVPSDKIAGCQWVILAAESGSKEAKGLLREMELFLNQAQLVEARKRAAEFKPARVGNPKS
jgi:tetratricopeptide (TPR) repeat protein